MAGRSGVCWACSCRIVSNEDDVMMCQPVCTQQPTSPILWKRDEKCIFFVVTKWTCLHIWKKYSTRMLAYQLGRAMIFEKDVKAKCCMESLRNQDIYMLCSLLCWCDDDFATFQVNKHSRNQFHFPALKSRKFKRGKLYVKKRNSFYSLLHDLNFNIVLLSLKKVFFGKLRAFWNRSEGDSDFQS